jgi:hypothetical protein
MLSTSAVVVLMLLTSFSALCNEEDKLKPSLFIKEKEADLGTIYEGADVSYEFVIENRGQAELNILRVKAP